ncbi:serine protease, partial [Solemya velum gill symbiont]
VITNPNVAYILMLIGIYGLILEFSNPGSILPGVTGAICLLLALYAFQLLPINYAGLFLILLGVALMVGEAFEPSFGILGIGGIIAFVIGSVILIDTEVPGFGISLPLIGAFALVSAALLVLIVGMAIKSHRRSVVSGAEELVGMQAEVLEDFLGKGRIRVHGELWQARSPVQVTRGEQVRVTGLDGLILDIEPENKQEDS